MSRFDGGFYALERRILTDYAGDLAGFGVWVWLIGRAEHKPKQARVFGEKDRRTIARGQVITGVDEIAKQWGLDEKIVRVRLAQLEAAGCITQEIRSGSKGGRIITICNYERYQDLRKRAPISDPNAGLADDASKGKDETNNSNGAADAGNAGTETARRRHGAGTETARSAGLGAGLDNVIDIGKDETNNSNGAADADLKKHGDGTETARRRHGAGTADPLKNHRTSDQQPGNQGLLFTDDAPASRPRKAKATRSEIAAEGKASKSGPTLEAYSTALMLTHGHAPPANAPLRSMACKLVDYVGAELAPDVAEYYVLNERTQWVLANRHPFGELVKNWQKYLTNYKTGQKITVAKARTVERDDGNRDAVERYLARKHGTTAGVT